MRPTWRLPLLLACRYLIEFDCTPSRRNNVWLGIEVRLNALRAAEVHVAREAAHARLLVPARGDAAQAAVALFNLPQQLVARTTLAQQLQSLICHLLCGHLAGRWLHRGHAAGFVAAAPVVRACAAFAAAVLRGLGIS